MWKPQWLRPKGPVARQPRVNVQLPLYVRELNEFGWLRGKTENISRTGVLFQFERSVEVGKSVEMNFTPPPEVWEGTLGTIYCRGKVVRSSPPVPPTRQSTVAAKILNFYGGRTQQDW